MQWMDFPRGKCQGRLSFMTGIAMESGVVTDGIIPHREVFHEYWPVLCIKSCTIWLWEISSRN